MTVIGVISDTHGQLSEAAYAALADSDHIIHAGDIGGPAILHELETLAPVTAVLGNNDFDEYGQAVSRFAHPVIDGVRFLVAHYPRDVKINFAGSGRSRRAIPFRRCASTGIRTCPRSSPAPRHGQPRTSCVPAPHSARAAGSPAA